MRLRKEAPLQMRLLKSQFQISAIASTLILTAPLPAQDPTTEVGKIEWQHGPTTANIGTQATFKLADGFIFADGNGARKFLEITHNLPSGNELGVLAPKGFSWFVIFTFDAVGYIKDDEKDKLDSDAMLNSIKAATEKANEEMKRRGWSTLTITGWVNPPHYDATTNNLEWALRAVNDQNETVVNHKTRYLGRRGVMSVELVSGQQEFAKTLPTFQRVMHGFAYKPDDGYRAFVKGDKIAEYGLTGLVIGGAAAVAAKTGVFKYLWKLIIIAVLAVGGWLKKLFSGTPKEDPTVTS